MKRILACAILSTPLMIAGCGGDKESVGPPVDTQIPVVIITQPSPGARLGIGAMTIAAQATDDHGVVRVDFFVDDAGVGTDASAAADVYVCGWNAPPGLHRLWAVAVDAAGNTGSDTVQVICDAPDDEGPVVTILEPQSGAIMDGGSTVIRATATDESGVARVEFFDRIRQRGEITWGADLQGGEPYVYEDPGQPDHIIGFEVDVMAAIARRLGVRSHMVQYSWSNLVPSLERGDFDVIANGLEATAERRERILLSEPYFVYAETLTVRTGSDIRSVFDLAGKRVGTLNQTYAHDILRMLYGDAAKVYEGNEEPYRDLELGRTDAVLLDNIIADRYGCTPSHPALTCLPYDVARGTYVIGIRKADPELKAAIDGALAAMRVDGELAQILRKTGLWDARQTEGRPPEGQAVRSRTLDGEMVLQFLAATWVTLELSVLAFLLAVPIGVLLAVGRVYGAGPVAAAARLYIELFRGTPVLLQLYVLYYGLTSVVHLGPVEAAVLGLGFNYGAYEAEVYRGALLAIPRGQSEAARALGLGPAQTLWHVLLPQALRLALPPMTNDFVSLLKDSSLVSAITVIELTKRMTIAAVDMRGWLVPGLLCAALYLVLSFPLSELARRLERRLARDQRPLAL